MGDVAPKSELENLKDTLAGVAERITSLEESREEKRPHRINITIAVAAVVVSIGSLAASWSNWSISKENLNFVRETRHRDEQLTSLEIADHFIDRFYQIEKEKEAKSLNFYYDRLYGLHSEEFTYYKNGLLDKSLYLAWLRFRNRRFQEDEQNEESQWTRAKEFHLVDPLFTTFMGSIVHAHGDGEITKILDDAVPSRR